VLPSMSGAVIAGEWQNKVDIDNTARLIRCWILQELLQGQDVHHISDST
jgi:hypothetical protein